VTLATTGAVVAAGLLDRLYPEPPTPLHPVAWFGRLVGAFDREWRFPGAVGLAVAAALPVVAGGAVALFVWGVARIHPVVGPVAATFALYASTSRRMLVETARRVVTASEADLPSARDSLLALAGRDAGRLSAGEVRSAAVESAAENLADGLVAPLVGFVLGSLLAAAVGRPSLALPLASGGAAWVKAVNTLDSMLGYRSKAVGRYSARLDDAVMWGPARASALVLALTAGAPGAVLDARSLARRPASPNSGWPMATLAVLLGTRLAKPGHYVLDAGPDLPSVPVAERGVRLVARAGWVALGLAAVLALPGVAWP
jgi:adenosylcobinamide-phosphate synthase